MQIATRKKDRYFMIVLGLSGGLYNSNRGRAAKSIGIDFWPIHPLHRGMRYLLHLTLLTIGLYSTLGAANTVPFDAPVDLSNGTVTGISSLDAADLNGDCYVDFADLAILMGEWLACGNPLDPNCGRGN